MNRADRLKAEGEGRRGNTVGFALTVLQRRLASSPEAIWRSPSSGAATGSRSADWRCCASRNQDPDDQPLRHRLDCPARAARPRRRQPSTTSRISPETNWKSSKKSVVDAATAATTVAELETEIAHSRMIWQSLARRVRFSGT